MSYGAVTFQDLADIEMASQAALSHEHKVNALGEAIFRHEFAQVVGISLLYKHFDLYEGEFLVSTHVNGEWRTGPEVTNESEVRPCAWKLEKNDQNSKRTWVPVEYLRRSPYLADENDWLDILAGTPEFFSEMAAELIDLEVETVFGLSLILGGDPGCQHTYLETNAPGARCMVTSLVPMGKRDPSSISTLWAFRKLPQGAGIEGKNIKSCCH